MSEGFVRGLESKPVYDYNHSPLGTIAGAALDPRTQDPLELIIQLNPQAREAMRGEPPTVAVPFDLVFGIRRHEVTLSRSLPEILTICARETPASAPRAEALLQR